MDLPREAPLGARPPLRCNVGISQNQGYHFEEPHNKDYSILGSMLGFPYLGKLPCGVM